MNDPLAGIVLPMEQVGDEIRPFARWLAERQPHNVLEIGVRRGGTAELWHSIATGIVVGVDRIGADSLARAEFDAVRDSLTERCPRFRFIEGDSTHEETHARVVAAFGGEPIDLLFLDGDHSLMGVTNDWRLYTPLLSDRALVAVHDIAEETKQFGHGVWKFWRELRGNKREFYAGGPWGGIGAWEVPA